MPEYRKGSLAAGDGTFHLSQYETVISKLPQDAFLCQRDQHSEYKRLTFFCYTSVAVSYFWKHFSEAGIMYFTYWQSKKNQQWYWNLKAGNHEIIAQGEGYHNKSDCLHAIGLVQNTDSKTPVRLKD